MMEQRGLVDDVGSDVGQVGITTLGGQQQPQQSVATVGDGAGVIDPWLAGTRWTHDDIRTLSSLATLLVALLALWEVARS